MGSLYRRGKVWWVKYSVAGRVVRESSRSARREDALRLLRIREGQAAQGLPVLARVRFEVAAADLRRHYATTGRRDLGEVERRLRPLEAFFGGRWLSEIGPAAITAYAAARQAAGLAPATINRELAMLRRLFRLAVEHGTVARVPPIRLLREPPPRAGFVEPAQFEALVRHLPEPHALAVRLCYTLGWRRGEVFGLERRHVDLAAGALRLEPGETKTGEGRLAFLPPELLAALRAHLERLDALQRQLGRVIPRLFVYLRGRWMGRPIRDFRKVWRRACRAAGSPGLLVHDLRRSGIRNMVRAGIPEHTAMKISGHRTRSVFDRYDIVSEGDLREAARRLAAAGTIWAQSRGRAETTSR
jgi:integrase